MTFHFVRPPLRRVLWSVIAVTVVSCVLVGTCLFIGAVIVSHNDPNATSTGDYIRLFIWFILLWGPSLLLIVWWISIPAIVVLGAVAASVRRTPAAEKSSERRAAEERSESG